MGPGSPTFGAFVRGLQWGNGDAWSLGSSTVPLLLPPASQKPAQAPIPTRWFPGPHLASPSCPARLPPSPPPSRGPWLRHGVRAELIHPVATQGKNWLQVTRPRWTSQGVFSRHFAHPWIQIHVTSGHEDCNTLGVRHPRGLGAAGLGEGDIPGPAPGHQLVCPPHAARD